MVSDNPSFGNTVHATPQSSDTVAIMFDTNGLKSVSHTLPNMILYGLILCNAMYSLSEQTNLYERPPSVYWKRLFPVYQSVIRRLGHLRPFDRLQ